MHKHQTWGFLVSRKWKTRQGWEKLDQLFYKSGMLQVNSNISAWPWSTASPASALHRTLLIHVGRNELFMKCF